ncbi:hypothetical protein ACHAWF_003257, partial [Thalassiosira exigua]
IELHRYIKDALKHLTDATTYQIISEEQARQEVRELRQAIYNWRPVCSDCGSLPHALGQWVDEQLQPIVKAQSTYFKNSFELKKELDGLQIPANASLFTYDAVSMYTKIDTEDCIDRLSNFLWDAHTNMTFPHYRPSTLLSAIALVMHNNRMRFGDIFVRQLSDIAMGMSPAPTIANLFVAIHEAAEVLQYLDTCLLLLRRFIDDGFGIWLHHPDPAVDKLRWESFQAAVNNGGLRWIFTERSTTVDCMDMTISLAGSKIETTLYCKPLARSISISLHTPAMRQGF